MAQVKRNQVSIDNDDLDLIFKFSLEVSHNGYIRCYIPSYLRRGSNYGHYVYLHRLVAQRMLGTFHDVKVKVDHINGNKFDVRRSNLRICNQTINGNNRTKLNKNSTSGIRGVTQRKDTGKWQAQVNPKGKHIALGCYLTKEEAEQAVKQYRAKHLEGSKEFDSK